MQRFVVRVDGILAISKRISTNRHQRKQNRYVSSAPPRGQYSVLCDQDLNLFESIVGQKNCQTSDLDPYNTDWLKAYKGSSKCILFPTCDQQVSAILKHCYSRNIAVVPQSGNTSLVGGSVPVYDEVILSIRKLNQHFAFDPYSGILECDAGMIMEDVDNRLATYGFMMPYDLGSRGSCLIGGNVSTGVGGVRHLRFGSLHNRIVGLNVVLADEKGSIVKFGSKIRKDNTNLHIHQIFVGSEGQLGIITRIIMAVVPRPNSIQVTMIGANSPNSCLEILRAAQNELCEILSAVELMDHESMICLEENENLKNVLKTHSPFNIIIETMGSDEEHDKEKIEKFMCKIIDEGLAVDGVQAADKKEATYIWKLRKTLPLAPLHDGFVFKHDISLPLKHFFVLSDIIKQRLGSLAKRVITFGHMADGDCHVNVSAKQYSPEINAKLYPFLCEWVVEHGGSISAEHGIGQERRPYKNIGKGYEIKMAEHIKRIFDPRYILSPYKMIYNENV